MDDGDPDRLVVRPSEGRLDELIAAAETALASDAPQDPRALMLFAELYRRRHERRGAESDLRRAVALSEQAVHERLPATDAVGLRRILVEHRFSILLDAVNTPGDWRDERAEMVRLLDDGEVELGESRPEVVAFRLWAVLSAAVDRLASEGALGPALDASTQLWDHLSGWADGVVRSRWLVELCILETQIHDACGFLEIDDVGGPDRLARVASAVQGADGADTPPSSRHRALTSAAEAWSRVATQRPDDDVKNSAFGAAEAAVEIGDQHPDDVPPVNALTTARFVRRLQPYVGRPLPSGAEGWELVAKANALPAAPDAPSTRLVLARSRVAAAGEGSLAVEVPAAAWVHLALMGGLDTADHERRRRLEETILARAGHATQVFIASTEVQARAVWTTGEGWHAVELPDLAVDRIGLTIREAYRTHQRAEVNEVWTREHHRRAHTEMVAAVAAAVAPLAAVIPTDRPIDVHLAGWAHVVPIVPILSSTLGHAVGVAAVMPTLAPVATGERSRSSFQAVTVSGGLDGILPIAEEDAEVVTDLLRGAGAMPDAPRSASSVTDLVEALDGSRSLLVSGHARASPRDPADSQIVVGSRGLSVGEILDLDLRHLDLVVLSACETMAAEAQLSENPLSLAAAFLHAGAGAVLGSHWRVDDPAASRFSRAFFAATAQGAAVGEAYRAACRATDDDGPIFTLAHNLRL